MASHPTSYLLLASIAISTPTLAQDAWAYRRGPTIVATVARASDGAHARRLRIDTSTTGCTHQTTAIVGGIRQSFRCNFQDANLGQITIEAELDLLGQLRDGSFDLLPRIKSLPTKLSVHSLGVELQMRDVAGTQRLLLPLFSGAEFIEPATTIPQASPIHTGVGHSVQATAYYADDGTGMLIWSRDPAATKPKHFRFAAEQIGSDKTTAIALEYYLPNSHLGGRPVEAPVRTAWLQYRFDPKLTTGWFVAGKLYRAWLETNARGPGRILERGPLATRPDVPKWMRELDLFVWDLYGWFPNQATVQDPLLHLKRLKTSVGADNVLVGLWFWNDQRTPVGSIGTWLPLPQTANQIKALRKDGIRFTGYVFPAAFDIGNPFLIALGLWREGMQDRAGQFVIDPGPPPTQLLRMDPASNAMADWYGLLALFHARESGLSGFYSDFPACVEWEDFSRPSGSALGITESSYEGYSRILRRSQQAANQAGHDFVQYHEAAFEWLIKDATAGQGAVGVLGRAYAENQLTRGVPFFHAIYSGYTLFWPADERFGPQILTLVPDTYGDPRESNMSRVLAEGFTWGALINTSEVELKDGRLFFESTWPEPFKTSFVHHRKTVQNLIAARRLAREWLVYGEMLNSPVVGGDQVTMRLRIPFGTTPRWTTFRKAAVPTTAWQARDGSLRVIAANGGRMRSSVVIDLDRLGLAGRRALVDVRTKERFAQDANGDITVPVDGGSARVLEPIAR